MDDVKEVCLELPWNVVDECNGFGLDFGGSVCKVIYLHKDDWAEPDKRTKETVPLRCVNFSRTEFDQALDYLKPRVCIRRKNPDDKPSVFTTGVGGATFAKEIQKTFDIRTTNITEFECFFAGFNFILRNSKQGDILHALNQDLIKKGVDNIREQMKQIAAILKDAPNAKMSSTDPSSISSPLEAPFDAEKTYMDCDNKFPCSLIMVGSNGGVIVVNEDGTYSFAADLKRAGRTFLGLGSMLTKSKSYEEIMSKAERGNMRPIHEYLTDLTTNIDKSEENCYVEMSKQNDEAKEKSPAFVFGKTVFKDIEDFRSEDLARSFLYMMVRDLVQTVHTAIRLFPQVKNVFFCGGFPDHPLTRDFIVEEWLDRDGTTVSISDHADFANIHFLKHGSHLGALGAYLNPHLKFKEVQEAAAEQKQT